MLRIRVFWKGCTIGKPRSWKRERIMGFVYNFRSIGCIVKYSYVHAFHSVLWWSQANKNVKRKWKWKPLFRSTLAVLQEEKPSSSSGASHSNYSRALLKAYFVDSVWGVIALLKRQMLEEFPYVSDRILSLDLLYLVHFALHLPSRSF